MRFARILYTFLLFLFSLGLLCSELPESLSLSDDTSNDFVEDSSSPSLARSAKYVKILLQHRLVPCVQKNLLYSSLQYIQSKIAHFRGGVSFSRSPSNANRNFPRP